MNILRGAKNEKRLYTGKVVFIMVKRLKRKVIEGNKEIEGIFIVFFDPFDAFDFFVFKSLLHWSGVLLCQIYLTYLHNISSGSRSANDFWLRLSRLKLPGKAQGGLG